MIDPNLDCTINNAEKVFLDSSQIEKIVLGTLAVALPGESNGAKGRIPLTEMGEK